MDGRGITGLIFHFNFYGLSTGENNRRAEESRLLPRVGLPRGGWVVQIHSVPRDLPRIFSDDQLQLTRIFSLNTNWVLTSVGDDRYSEYHSSHSGAVIVLWHVSDEFRV